MVDEFSAFARMPAPKFTQQDAAELLRAAVFAQRVASPDLDVSLVEPLPEPDGAGRRADAVAGPDQCAEERRRGRIGARRGEAAKAKGHVVARLVLDEQGATFEIEENGVGLPDKDRDRLTEPYVTTREKGTGLGLAIVKRILEDPAAISS